MTKRKNRRYTNEFKQEAVALVTEQGYSVPRQQPLWVLQTSSFTTESQVGNRAIWSCVKCR